MWEQMYYSDWTPHRSSEAAAVQRFNWIYANLDKLWGKSKGIKVHKGAESVEMRAHIL